MTNTKKQFQKVIGNIRKVRNTENGINSNFPKPMMTAIQMGKRQATVNCGGEWSTAEKTRTIADEVMQDEGFKTFLGEYNATASIELNNFNTFQIRIQF